MMKVVDKFCKGVCPNYAEAGDLSSLATLAVYATVEPTLGTIAVATMLLASVYNTSKDMLDSMPVVVPVQAIKPVSEAQSSSVLVENTKDLSIKHDAGLSEKSDLGHDDYDNQGPTNSF